MFAYCSVGKLHGATGGVPRHGGVHICISGQACSHSFAVCGVWLLVVSGGSPVGVLFNGMVGGFELLLIPAGDVPKLVAGKKRRKPPDRKTLSILTLHFFASNRCVARAVAAKRNQVCDRPGLTPPQFRHC